jgi:hypothetical protein
LRSYSTSPVASATWVSWPGRSTRWVGPGGQDQQSVGGQQVLAAGQDLLEGLEQGGLVDPAEVGWVGGVGVVELGHAMAGAGGDLAMDAPTVGW